MSLAATAEQMQLIIIQGPTAAGKTELAVRLAEHCDGEIVNADSMQIYRGMDIGTAKPSATLLRRVPHHLLDIVAPDQPFSAADFRAKAVAAIQEIHNRGKRVIVVGGTGLYIKALTQGLIDSPEGDETIRAELAEVARVAGREELLRQLNLVDPVTAARLHPNDQVRIIRALEVFRMTGCPISVHREKHAFQNCGFRCLKIGITKDRTELYRRIDNRVDWMVQHGFIEEVQTLLGKGFAAHLKPMRSLGYRQICAYLAGVYSLDEAIRLIKRDTRHYAKRQLTWFKKDLEIKWFEYPENVDIIFVDAIEFYD
jgi:tRNA dimethylallyltransferase